MGRRLGSREGQPMTTRVLDRASDLPAGMGLMLFAAAHWLVVVAGFLGFGMVRTVALGASLLGLVLFLTRAD